jgi:hypothetical protein
MAEMIAENYGTADAGADIKLPKISRDVKNKHKTEARRRIDDLMEQKRLRQMLDMDDEDILEIDLVG